MTEQLTREDLCKSLDRVAKRTKSKLIAMRCYIAKVEAIEKSVSQLSELLKASLCQRFCRHGISR